MKAPATQQELAFPVSTSPKSLSKRKLYSLSKSRNERDRDARFMRRRFTRNDLWTWVLLAVGGYLAWQKLSFSFSVALYSKRPLEWLSLYDHPELHNAPTMVVKDENRERFRHEQLDLADDGIISGSSDLKSLTRWSTPPQTHVIESLIEAGQNRWNTMLHKWVGALSSGEMLN